MTHTRSRKGKANQRRRKQQHEIRTAIYASTYHDPLIKETVATGYGKGNVGWIKFYIQPGEVLENSTRTGTLDLI